MNRELTIHDKATALVVTPSTVGQPLAKTERIRLAARKKVFDKTSEPGYVYNSLASKPLKQKPATIGGLLHTLNGNFITPVLAGIEQGCKRIVILTADLQQNVFFQRNQGYTNALFDAGIACDENIVLITDLKEESGFEAARAG